MLLKGGTQELKIYDALLAASIRGGCVYASAWERAPSLRPKTQLHFAANRESLILCHGEGRDGSRLLTPSVDASRIGSFSERRTQTDQKLSWISPNAPCATFPVPPALTG
jgi:hypothetical protein